MDNIALTFDKEKTIIKHYGQIKPSLCVFK